MRAPRQLVIGLGAVLLLAGCTGANAAMQAPSPGQPIVATAGPIPYLEVDTSSVLPVTVTDATGARVTVTDLSRIVSLSGGVTELLFAMGLHGNVVGRDVTSDFAGTENIPLVSQGHDVSAEGVLALNPTLILADTQSGPPEAIAALRAVGVPVVILPEVWSIAEAIPRAQLLTTALGMPSALPVLSQALGGRTSTLDQPLTVAFLYLRGTAAVYLMGGKGSGADSLIQAIGGVDAGTKAGFAAFTPLTPEALVASAPDVILVMEKGLTSVGGIDGLLKLPGVAQTPAGRNTRVVSVPDGELLSFGPRTTGMLDGIVAQLNAMVAASPAAS
ncbi:MAG: ABC transporter substrate-binding protein [Actinomycetota bacterium]|nr:ABC transporter substrate-binding protein [Actinomycetota bacterium]